MQFKKLLVRSIFWRGLYFVTVLLLNIVVARYFKATGSGWIYYLSSLYALMIVLASVSLDSGIGFFASRKEVTVNKLVNLLIFWAFIVGLLVSAGAYLYYKIRSDHSLSASILFVSSLSYVCGNLLTNFSSSIFYAYKNFRGPNLIGIGCNLMLVLVLMITRAGISDWLNSDTFLNIYFLFFLAQGLLMVGWLIYVYSRRWRPVFLSGDEFKKILRYSLLAFAGNIIFFLVYRVDYFFVKYYCSAADLGNYIQVSKFVQMMILIPSIIASAVFPMVAGGQREEVNRGLKLLSRISLLVIGLCCALLVLIGHWLFPFLFGESFNRIYVPFILLIPGILSLSSLYPLTAYYSGKNKLMVNVSGSVIALIFIVIADLFLIPYFGINAAALVSSIGYILYHAYVLTVFRKEYKTTVIDFFVIRRSDFIWIRSFFLKVF